MTSAFSPLDLSSVRLLTKYAVRWPGKDITIEEDVGELALEMRIALVVSTPEVEVQPLGLGGRFQENVEKIAELGYDGVELFVGDPSQLVVQEVNSLIEDQGLEISAIGTGLTYVQHGLSFASPDAAIRKGAVRRIERYIRLAGKLRSNVIIGSVKGRFQTSYENGWNCLMECLERCARVASDSGVYLLLEPLNRYESNIINTLGEAIKLAKEIDCEQIKVMGDTFHMNIEEVGMHEAIRNAKEYIRYIHFADSNRQAPGRGHLDFKRIIDALREIGYTDFVSAEILPTPDQDAAARFAIDFLRRLFQN